jgi:hypothetical protein
VSRLHRPHISLAVRVLVAERQFREAFPEKFGYVVTGRRTAGKRLRVLLAALFPDGKCELHHRPALVNRRRYVRHGKVFYDPPANDPNHLIYLAEDVHDIETRVRGLSGQHSDLGLARKAKRVARTRDKKRRRAKIKSRGFQKGGHWVWPKRKMRGGACPR